ncbi:MAG: PIN domain nuclease [Thermoprotei archaeon]|nr:MAG: PIN domain nuclease [Thermoprotei archaeon]
MRFIDSNVFIYHMAGDPNYGDKASSILERIERGEEAAVSTLAIAQVCSYLKWKRRADVIPSFIAFLSSLPNLVKVETTFLDLVEAADLCREVGWDKWDDVIIAIQMKKLGVDEIYSNDKDLDQIPSIRRVFD